MIYFKRVKPLMLCICSPVFVTCRYLGMATTDNMWANPPEELWN